MTWSDRIAAMFFTAAWFGIIWVTVWATRNHRQ